MAKRLRRESYVEYEGGKYHSANGPLKVSNTNQNAFAKIILQAGEELGIPYINELNADKHVGFANTQRTTYKQRRESNAKAFLIPAKHRKNLHIIKHAFVEKIIINSNNQHEGVEFVYKEANKMKAFASKEVILSAGSISSPQILMLSGIGPKKHLQNHKILVKSDLPVGENLYDHITAYIFFSFNSTKQLDNVSPTVK